MLIEELIKMPTHILIQIKYIKNKKKLKDLRYLVHQHQDIIEDLDISFFEKANAIKIEFTPWLIVKNEGKGLYLAKKILSKFEPWVSLYALDIVYKNNIPKEILELEKWTEKATKKFSKMKLLM